MVFCMFTLVVSVFFFFFFDLGYFEDCFIIIITYIAYITEDFIYNKVKNLHNKCRCVIRKVDVIIMECMYPL